MSHPIRQVLLLGSIALLAAACGASTASGSLEPGSGSPALPSPSASTEVLPSESVAGETGAPGASGAMTQSRLMAILPTAVDGRALTSRAVSAAELPFFDSTAGTTALGSLTSALGIGGSDLAAALATSQDEDLAIGALALPTADPTAVTTAISGAMTAAGLTATSSTMGGKSVQTVTVGGRTIAVYATPGVLFVVQATDAALAETAVTALP